MEYRRVELLPASTIFLGFIAITCTSPPPPKVASLGEERVLVTYPPGIEIYDVAAARLPGGKMFLAWSLRDGIHALFLDGSGKPIGREIIFEGEGARMLSTAAAGKDDDDGVLLLSFPFVSPFEGSRPAMLRLLGSTGAVVATLELSPVGPFSMGGVVDGTSGYAIATWHTGKVGEFAVEAARIDLSRTSISWQQRLSTTGWNAFRPALSRHKNCIAVAWLEKKTTIGNRNENESRGVLRLAVMNENGETIKAPSAVSTSLITTVAPSLYFDDTGMTLIYKDHPTGEYREGIYWLKIDPEGNRVAAPRRIARADGPGNPILLPLKGAGFSTIVLRQLAGDQLVGINIVNAHGRKLQKELQIYSHRLKYSNPAAVAGKKSMTVIYTTCPSAGCRLALTEIALHRRLVK